MSELPVNHAEAAELAALKRDESNLARCYIEAAARIATLEAALGEAREFIAGDSDIVDIPGGAASRLLARLDAALSASPSGMVVAVADVAAERRRQVEAEGWSSEHDDQHSNGEMATAAACYLVPQYIHWPLAGGIGHLRWPWTKQWWKPKNRRRDLIRAAALIVAEIERLDRLSPAHAKEGG